MSDLPAGVRGACRVLATGLLLVTGLSVCLVFINRPCPKMGAAAHRAAVTRRGAADPRPPQAVRHPPLFAQIFWRKKNLEPPFFGAQNSLAQFPGDLVKQGGLKEPPRASRPEQRTP